MTNASQIDKRAWSHAGVFQASNRAEDARSAEASAPTRTAVTAAACTHACCYCSEAEAVLYPILRGVDIMVEAAG